MRACIEVIGAAPTLGTLARLAAAVTLVALCGCGGCGSRGEREPEPSAQTPGATPAPTGSLLGRKHLVGPKRHLAAPHGPATRLDGAAVVDAGE